jgi:hypothetical protein
MSFETDGFKIYFNPCLEGFKQKKGSWFYQRRPLSDEIIQDAINGKKTIGFRLQEQASVFGLDLDDHLAMGWKRSGKSSWSVGTMTESLARLVNEVRIRVGVEPSMMVRSSQGMHVYWFFSRLVAFSDIRDKVRGNIADLLGTNRFEILPTPTQELRIPKRSWIIRPGTVADRMYDRRRTPGVVIDWEEFAVYDPDDFFEAIDRAVWTVGIEGEASYLFESTNTTLLGSVPVDSVGLLSDPGNPFAVDDTSREIEIVDDETDAYRSSVPWSVEDAERDVMPFANGRTNEQLPLMVNAGKRSGLTESEVVDWIFEWVDRSRGMGYTGDLGRNPGQLRRRIEYYCDRFRSGRISYLDVWNRFKDQASVDDETVGRIYGRVASAIEVKPRQERYFHRFIWSLLTWQDILNRLVPAEPEVLAGLNQWAGYRALRRNGWLPLPVSLLRSWYEGYKLVLDGLAAAGIVIPESSYHPGRGLPRWYSIYVSE